MLSHSLRTETPSRGRISSRRRREEEYRVQQERFYKDQYFKGNTHRQRSPIRRRRNEYY